MITLNNYSELSKVVIPSELKELIKLLPYDSMLELEQIGEDIWYTDRSIIEPHKDSTEEGKNTVVTIIMNEQNMLFHYENKNYILEEGSVFRFNARLFHCLFNAYSNKGRFAAMIWDVPNLESDDKIASEISKEILNKCEMLYTK